MNITLTISDLISLCGILVSLLISTFTLVYNAKVLRDSLKPDVQAYIDYLGTNDSFQFLIIKNFGKTATIIKNIEHNIPAEIDVASNLINNLSEVYLAPNQIIYLPIETYILKNKYNIDKIYFKFNYTFNKRKLKFENYLSLYPGVSLNINYPTKTTLNKIYSALNRLLSK